MAKGEVGGPGSEHEEGMEIQRLSGAMALGAVDRASIDSQIATAKEYPRSVDRAVKEAITLATLDEETAGSMTYGLPRGRDERGGKKLIEGPSARLAEVMLYSWGNIRADADIVAEEETYVTAMGTCFDVEKNVAVRVRVNRRITDRNGNRYNDDMINVTKNAAISIALRNAVFKVIPRALADRVWRAARQASLGKGGTMTQKRQQLVSWFGQMAIQPQQIFDLLEVNGLDDIGENELIQLRGLANSIKDGEISVESAFANADPASEAKAATGKTLADLQRDIAEAAKKKEEKGPEPESPAEAAKRGQEIKDSVESDGPPLPDDEEEEETKDEGPPPPVTAESLRRKFFAVWRETGEAAGADRSAWQLDNIGVLSANQMSVEQLEHAIQLLQQGIGLDPEAADEGDLPD